MSLHLSNPDTNELQRTRAKQEEVTSLRIPNINTSPAPDQSAPVSAHSTALHRAAAATATW